MKRLYPIIAFLLFAIPCMAYDFSAPDVNGNTIYYNFLGGDSVEVTYETDSYNSYLGDVVIPELVNNQASTYRVVAIGEHAFYKCTGLTSITIPNSVTSIGNSAFHYCTGLTSITIPNSVTTIGSHAFYNCTGLTSITISNGVTSIGSSAFENCKGLTSVTIPNSVVSIGNYAFYNCTALTSVHITDLAQWCKIKFLDNSSNPLYDAHHLYVNGTEAQYLEIPDGVDSISDYAFYKCTSLISVTIPNSVTSIGRSAFSGCTGLTSVTIPNSVISIGSSAFSNCTGLLSITIPNSVSSIDNSTFYSCSGLTSITIPNSVISIGSSAFSNCTGLLSITIPNSVTSIGSSAFYNCRKINSVYITDIAQWCKIKFGGTSLDLGSSNPLKYAHHLYVNGTEAQYLEIPDGVDSISDYAFYNCTSLTSVTIPNSVVSIGGNAFYKVPNIIYYGSATGSPWGARSVNAYVDGYFVYADNSMKSLLACSSVAAGAVSIPNSVMHIGTSAFYDCAGLTSITIPNSVTTIGSSAFYKCTSLTSITIPNSVTTIGGSAFYNCTGLTSVHITDIAQWCKIKFSNYSSNPLYYAHHLYMNGAEATDIEIPEGVDSISDYAFYYCTGLTSVTIPNGVTTIGNYAFSGCTGLTSVTIPNSVISIGSSAFSNCTGLLSITIPNSVTTIGSKAFDGCSGLTSVKTSNLATWCKIRFADYTSNPLYKAKHLYVNDSEITDVEIPGGVDSIGDYAFYNCTSLTSIKLPSSVTTIGKCAFYDCDSLASITTSSSVTTIGKYAFYDCKSLTSITIPNSVILINDSAFYNCTGLTSVHITDIAQWCKIMFPDSYSNPLYYAHHLYVNGTEAQYLEIPDGVDSISDYAFYNCTSLTSVTIPNSVVSIGGNAFYEVPNIAYYGSATGSPWGARSVNAYVDGYFVYADNSKKELLACSSVAKGDISISSSVTSIGRYALYDCTGLTSITIPNSVTTIGGSAFYNCTGLTSVHITDIAQWCKIQFVNPTSNPLYYAKHLYMSGIEVKDFEIPDGVDSISDYAFYKCTSLISVTIPNSVTSIGNSAFYNCTGLTSVTIPNSVVSIGISAFYNCSNIDSVYCYAVIPPTIVTTSFRNVSPTAILFVPFEAVESYRAISAYADAFAEIKGFSDAINITETTADIIWLPDPEVTQYTITVYKNDVQFAQYIVDGDGQVISSQRFLPSIYRHKQDTTQSSTEYFTVSVDELEAGTEYTYTIEGSNSQQEQIYHEEGTFQTNNHEGIFDPIINDPKSTRKIIRNGKIYILRGDAIYDTQGRLIDIK